MHKGATVHKGLKTYFFTGILLTAPLGITLYVIYKVILYIDSTVTALIPEKYNPNTYLPFGIPCLGVILLFLFLIIVGMFGANFLGKLIVNWSNRLIDKMPVISGLYNIFRKIFETIFGQGKETAFHQPVLVEYPRKGLWTIAFLTGPVYEGVQKNVSEKLVTIYVPTTPNPTSGFLIYVPKKDVILLDMGVDEAFKIVLSTGIVNPVKGKEKK